MPRWFIFPCVGLILALRGHLGRYSSIASTAQEQHGKRYLVVYLLLAALEWGQFFCFLPALVCELTHCATGWHTKWFAPIGTGIFWILFLVDFWVRRKLK